MADSESKFLFYGCKVSKFLQDYWDFQPCLGGGSVYGLSTVLCQQTGGKATLTEGHSANEMQH